MHRGAAQRQKVPRGRGGEMLSVGWAPGGDACEGRGPGPCEMHSITRAKTRGGGAWQKGPKIHQPCRAEGRSRGAEREIIGGGGGKAGCRCGLRRWALIPEAKQGGRQGWRRAVEVWRQDVHSHATLGRLLKVTKQSFPPVCSRDNKSTYLPLRTVVKLP